MTGEDGRPPRSATGYHPGMDPQSPPVRERAGPSLPPGTRLGRFTVTRLLGAGGMGAVYEGQDPELDRAVALKVLDGERRAGPPPGSASSARRRRSPAWRTPTSSRSSTSARRASTSSSRWSSSTA
jgi:hypothetical protein